MLCCRGRSHSNLHMRVAPCYIVSRYGELVFIHLEPVLSGLPMLLIAELRHHVWYVQ